MSEKARFFFYSQNNSGGSFTGPAEYVIVEAHSAREANSRAEELGLYWNGCEEGLDCHCCGDRWSEAWSDDEGDEKPMIYDKPVEDYTNSSFGLRDLALVYYLDGTKKLFGDGAKS